MTERADLVVVGAGTIGGWASVFAKAEGLGRVVVVERGLAGMGASSRAAGIVRAQGGTPATVALGRWTHRLLQRPAGRLRHRLRLPRARLPDPRGHRGGRARRPRAGRDAAGGGPRRPLARRRRGRRRPRVTLSPDGHRGGSYIETDGAHRPAAQRPRLRARDAAAGRGAARAHGVHRACARPRPPMAPGRPPSRPTRGVIETERVLLTGGPSLRAVGRLAGLRIPAGAVRHTVAVLEPQPRVRRRRACRWSSTSGPGLYWRLEEGGLLFGWSNPDEPPGEDLAVDWPFHERMRERLAAFVPRPAGSACAGSGPRPSTTRPTTCRSSARR